MRKALLTAAIVGLGLFAFTFAANAQIDDPVGQHCTGPCYGESFPCCCNGDFIGCYTSILGCYNGCDPQVEEGGGVSWLPTFSWLSSAGGGNQLAVSSGCASSAESAISSPESVTPNTGV